MRAPQAFILTRLLATRGDVGGNRVRNAVSRS